MKMENMKVGNTYIIKGKNAYNDRSVHKVTVKEITQETLLLYYEDGGNTIRILKSEFDYQWKVIEDLGNLLKQKIEDIIKSKNSTQIINSPTYDSKICYCDCSCNKQLERILFNQNLNLK